MLSVTLIFLIAAFPFGPIPRFVARVKDKMRSKRAKYAQLNKETISYFDSLFNRGEHSEQRVDSEQSRKSNQQKEL